MASFAPLRPADPRSLGGLRLLGRLGEGGQGVVYLGEDAEGGKAAVKWLRADLAGDESSVQRFLREVEVARHVAPFCTAAVLGTGIEQDRPYIVSEYIEGPSLHRVVQEQGPRTGTALHRLAVGTATALAAIHQAGIVHRDFKPANVIIGADGPRVIDFGIARALNATTISQSVVGTPSYMAPEQFMGHAVGPAADLFSWAGTIIFAATGQAPFGSDTMPAVINRVLNRQPDLGPLDGTLREVVAACLAKDPAQRPTAEQVMVRLLRHPASGSGMLAEGAAAASSAPFPGPPALGSPVSGPLSQAGPRPAGLPVTGAPAASTPPHTGAPAAGPPSQQHIPPGHPHAWQHLQPTHPAAKPPDRRRGQVVASVTAAVALLLAAVIFAGVQMYRTASTAALQSTTPSADTERQPSGSGEEPTGDATGDDSEGRTEDQAEHQAEDVPGEGTKRKLPGGDISLYESPSDAIVLTSYEVKDAKKDDWIDYARDSLRGKFTKYAGNMESLVSPDGRYLASRGRQYTPDDHDFIVITDRRTGQRHTIKTVKSPLDGIIMRWSKDGGTILLSIAREVGDELTYPGFMLVDVATKRVRRVGVSDTAVRRNMFAFDGDNVGTVNVYGPEDNLNLRFFDPQGRVVRSQEKIGTLPAGTTEDIFSPSGKAYVTNCPDGTYNDHCIWDAATGKRLHTFYSDCDEVLGFYDDKHLYCWENDNGANAEVQVVDFKGKLVRKLLEAPEELDVDPVFTRNPARGS
ncbi:protein kinase [Nonomuraea fastidiosa]|uniref:protein kinase domain-containing protein n=1 Tax=Nonomuraea fastidiosa TaxID=46173 RepID=UPI00366E0B59